MKQDWGSLCRVLLLLLVQLTEPGTGNEGSIAGSCPCDKRISSSSPPVGQDLEQIRNQLKAYSRCRFYVRFQIQSPSGSRSVCGGSRDNWVRELMSCLDKRECGRSHSGSMGHQKHLPPSSTLVPEPTKRALLDMSTTAQMNQRPTIPSGTLSLGKMVTQTNDNTTSSMDHSLETRSETGKNQKQMEENVGPVAGTSALVPVLSLLGIIFFLTSVLVYVLCKKRRQQLLQYSSDLQLQYSMTPDSNA